MKNLILSLLAVIVLAGSLAGCGIRGTMMIKDRVITGPHPTVYNRAYIINHGPFPSDSRRIPFKYFDERRPFIPPPPRL